MLGAGGTEPGFGGPMRCRGPVLAVAVAAVVVILAGCAVDGSGAAAPGEVSRYHADVSASKQADIRRDGVNLCREMQGSMMVMVRGYNTFVRRLNAVHSYTRVGDLDEKARASLIAGADQIRPKVTAKTPADVAEPTRRFLGSTTRLDDAIRRKLRVGLNPVSTTWTRDKNAVLTICKSYLPLPPSSSATPQPSASRPSG